MSDVTGSTLADALRDRYTIERELGRGGMATVFLVHDLKHDRDVALKVLRPELAAILGRERFLAEIRLTAKLDHPHILTLIDSGESHDSLWYVVPFVRGESLRQKLVREKQLGIEEALAIGQQVASALDYAHRQGVIHRDIKPENILLHEGEAMLADFGIAMAVREAGGQRLTETGLSVGTPQYMSPEQATGDRELDGRSDVYSLAAVLYELLAGEPPHSGATAQAVIAKLMTTEPVSLRIIRPGLPAGVEEVIHRGLTKVREDRYARAGLLLEALRRPQPTSNDHPTLPPHPGKHQEALRAIAGSRWMVVVGLIATLLTGLYLLWQRSHRTTSSNALTPDARRVAVLYLQSPGTNDSLRPLADGLTEGLITALAQVPELEIISRNGVAPFRDANVPRDSVARALKVGTLVEGNVDQVADRVRVTVRLVDAASGAEFQRASFERPAGDYVSLGDSLAQQAALFLRERLGVELRLRQKRSSTKSPEAWILLQRAELARKAAEAAAAEGDTLTFTLRFADADSLAKLASDTDPSWNDPPVFRGRIFYRRSRLALDNPAQASRYIDQGMVFAETAVARDIADPDALELRGTLRYWKWLLRLEQDPTAAKALFASARKDLEAATRLSPTQAGAWSSLSHLYYLAEETSETDVVLAARRAYESDAYLENAPKIIDRLFSAYYDLDQSVDAAHWCEEGYRRFPGNGYFTLCQLYLMTMRGQNPDPAKAWQLANSEAVANDPDNGSPELQKRDARLMVAAILARAGLKDSARMVARDGPANTEVDATRYLYLQQAFVLLLADDKPGAIRALKVYLAANPDSRKLFAKDPGWRFRELSGEPAFRDLVGAW